MYAADGQTDSAFAYLEQTKHTETVNVTRIGVDSRSTSLREDPRYLALFPTEAELAHPFLEAATRSAEETVVAVRRVVRELEITMFCIGARSVAELQRVPLEPFDRDRGTAGA